MLYITENQSVKNPLSVVCRKKPFQAERYFLQNSIRYRAAGAGGLDFGRLVNPISTRGADYAHHITTCPPDFQTFLRPLNSWYFNVKSYIRSVKR